tara:strand:- start:230 stop:523 length:294 start_codon:yes stop_codon:yes gene_type:complete
MPVKLQTIIKEKKGSKSYKATFIKNGYKKKIVRFGTDSNFLNNPKKTEQDKINYKKRHTVRENFNNPETAGSLSNHILWNTRNLQTNIKQFKNKFDL